MVVNSLFELVRRWSNCDRGYISDLRVFRLELVTVLEPSNAIVMGVLGGAVLVLLGRLGVVSDI